MNDIDRKIQEALARGTAQDENTLEPNLPEEVLQAFRGRNRLITTLMAVVSVVFAAAGTYAAVRFLHADSMQAQLQWGAAFFALWGVAIFVKLWFWLEMHTNRVLRELKRMELRLAARR
jgi:hypothetical protein